MSVKEDLYIAKDLIKDSSLVFVKNGKMIWRSEDRGILPLYQMTLSDAPNIKGSVLVDKVIGKAAAMICVYKEIKHVHGIVMSESAMKVLEDADVSCSYDLLVANIINRAGNDSCPVEKLSHDENDINNLLVKIKAFLDSSE